MTNITVATFAEGVKVVQTEPLHQYDYGQILRFVGIDDAMDSSDNYEVHFSNSDLSGSAKAVVGGTSGVIIPDEYLASGADIHAWIYTHTGASDQDEEYTDGRTSYEVIIPVLKRARPSDMPPTPTGRDTIVGEIQELQGDVHDINESIDGIAEDIDDLTPRVETLEGKTANLSASGTATTVSGILGAGGTITANNPNGACDVRAWSSARRIALFATADGICGLYDNTNDSQILRSGTDQTVSIPHPLITSNYGAANSPVVLGSGTDGNRISFMAGLTQSGNQIININSQWGAIGGSYTTRAIATSGSDKRLKENIKQTKKSGLDLINSLKVMQFDWKTGGHWDFGIIAQDAREQDENLVIGEEKEDSYLGIDTLYLCDILIKAVQELSAEVELLKAKLEDRGVID